jgi:DNA mismatch repair protein MLH1
MATIHRLSTDVINRIAAGEVVQRPSAALKELIENAIDADCSRIQVLAADGGLEVLQVSDDGSGIHKEDLPLLCERYATSKLQNFEDLQRVTSFGFRGEALASISYVSRVTVTTRRRPLACNSSARSPTALPSYPSAVTAPSQVAWRAQYLNGSLTSDPQPCAGNPGTTIRAEKLFYNALVRRNSLRGSEEWGRIVDVVSRYALAYPKIGFTCQRDQSYNSGGASGATGGGGGAQSGGGVSFPPNSTTRQNIRLSHGSHIVSHLRLVYAYEVGVVEATADGGADGPPHIKAEDGGEDTGDSKSKGSSSDEVQQGAAQEIRVFAQMERRANRVRSTVGPAGEGLFTLVGYTSDPTLAQRKPYLCLFINQRLVESTAIRKAIDGVYSSVLTGGNRPFTVLFLTVPTDRLDVNVHPTKKEVLLLDEELVVARVSEVCRGAVLEAAAARQMDMLKMRHTTALALKQFPVADGSDDVDGDLSGSSSQHILQKLRDQHRRGAPMISPLTSSSPAAPPCVTPAGGPAVVVAPCTMVRVEPQKGALDRYFSQRLAASSSGGDGGESTGRKPATNPAATASAVSVDTGDEAGVPRVSAGACPEEHPSALGVPSATPTYAAPSWDAVMASLHRTSGACRTNSDDDDRPNTTETRDSTAKESATTDTDAVQSAPGCRSASSVNTATASARGEPFQPTRPVPTDSIACVKRERSPGVDAVEVEENLRLSKGPGNRGGRAEDGDEDENEEDRMREFKRHRRDVHTRAAALRRSDIFVIKTEEGAAPAVSVKQETNLADDRRGARAEASGDEAGVTALAAVRRVTEEQNTLERLEAVVRAADLLRDEAAVAAENTSTFAHVVSSGEESEGEDEKRTADGCTRDGTRAKEAALVPVAEVEAPAVLSSVSMVVDGILANTSPSAAALTGQLTYVGVVDGRSFLAQVGTTLVWCDTMRLVRHVVFQRIFLRWGQPSLPAPPVLEFDVPLPLSDLIATALAFDASQLQPPAPALLALMDDCNHDADSVLHACSSQDKQSRQNGLTAEAVERMGSMSARAWRQLLFQHPSPSSTTDDCNADPLPQPKQATHRYIRRLVRRLCRWRGLLKEYFYVDITADGLLLGVPYGLNRHWPPLLRALPLTLWQLAEAVPYPSLREPADKEHFPEPGLQTARGEEGEVAPTPASPGTTPGPTQTVVEAEADGVAQEVACFTAVARHLAETLYGLHTPPPPPATADVPPHLPTSSSMPTEKLGSDPSFAASTNETWWEELVQHGLFPCLKNAQLFRLPDQCLRDGTIQSMVSVESLYKVFERC